MLRSCSSVRLKGVGAEEEEEEEEKAGMKCAKRAATREDTSAAELPSPVLLPREGRGVSES